MIFYNKILWSPTAVLRNPSRLTSAQRLTLVGKHRASGERRRSSHERKKPASADEVTVVGAGVRPGIVVNGIRKGNATKIIESSTKKNVFNVCIKWLLGGLK